MAGKYASVFDSSPKEESFIYLKIVTEKEKPVENSALVEETPFHSSASGKVEYVATDSLCFVRPDLHEKVIFTRQAKEKISQDEWNGLAVVKNSRFDIPCSSKQNESSSRFPIPKVEGRKAPGANRVLPLITSVWEDNDVHRKRQKMPKIGSERQHAKGKLSTGSRKHGHGNLNLEEENEEWLEKWDFDDLGGSIYRAYTDFFMSEEVGESREDCICSECGMEFLTAMNVAHHLEVSHDKGVVKLHQCFVCRRKRYPSLLQLNQHLSEAHGIPRPQLTCRTCFMELVGESEAKAHSRKHQTPYKCPRCPLSQPQNGHSVSVPRFATQFLLSEHLREVHLPLERPFSCPICGRHFIHEFVRNLHFSRRHTNHSLICPEVRLHFSSSSLPGLPSLNDPHNSFSSDTPHSSNANRLNVLGDHEDSTEVLNNNWKNASPSKSFNKNRFPSVANKDVFERLSDDCLDLQIILQQKTVSCTKGNYMFPDDVSLLRHVFKCHEKEIRVQLLKWAKEVDREDTLFEKLWSSYLNTPKEGTVFKISSNEEVKSALEPVNEVDMEVLVKSGRNSLSFQSPNRQLVDHHLEKIAEDVYDDDDATPELAHVFNTPSNHSSCKVINPKSTISSSTLLDATKQLSQISSKLSTASVPSLSVAGVHEKRPLKELIPALKTISNSSDMIANAQPTYPCLLKSNSHPHPSEAPNECTFVCSEISESVKSCLMDIVKVVCDVFDEGSSVKDSKSVPSQSSPQKAASVRCLLCRYLASSAMALERHRRRRHFRNKHCPFCSLACQSIEAVGRHVSHSHLNSLAKDTNDIVSKEGSKEPEESVLAQKMVQPSSGLRCPICKKIFSSRGKCNSHQETVHKMEVVARPLQCDICSKKFQFQKALDRHKLLHRQNEIENGNQNLYSCPHCEQTFLRPGFLERHIASHFDLVQKEGKGEALNGTFGHLCKYCMRRLPTQAKLKAHVRTSHPPSHLKQRFVCSQCPVKCNTASGLRVHMRVHTGERPYNCTECSMSFKRKTALRKHISAVHTVLTKPDIDGVHTFLKCSDCSSSFRDRSNLVRHFLQVHRGLRRFVCGVCGAKYAQNQDLRRHLKGSHDVDAPKIIGSDRRSADQIYVVPPLPDDLPQDHPLVAKICAIVEEEEQKLNEDSLPNFTETTQQLHLHIHKEPILNGEKVSKSSKEKEISNTNDNVNPKEYGSDLMDSVEVVHTDVSAKIQCKSISIKDDKQGRFVKVNLKSSREISSGAKENGKSIEDKSSFKSQKNLILNALISTQMSPDAIQLHGITSHSEQSLMLNQVLSANHIESKGLENNPSHVTEMNIVMTKELPTEEEDFKNGNTDSLKKHEAKDLLNNNEAKSKEDSLIKKKKAIYGDFTCCQCGKEFLDAARLERHSKIHTDSKPHVCAVCGKSFVEKYNLKVHMRSHTGERPYKCEVCGKSMRYLKEINDHRRMHLGEKPHVCDICSRAFLRLRDLQRHAQIHLNIKKHHCPICNKAFSRLDHLRTVHMRVHEPWRSAVSKTSEKTFKSSVESDGVSQSKSLAEKCRSNKQENFACEKCSKTFSTKAKLEKHLVLHSGQKAYKCSTCGRSFALASYLSAHQRTHEKQQAYLQCPKCPRRFVSQETLSVHEVKFHQRIEKMKKFQSSEQSLKGGRSKDLTLDICDEERFFMTRTGEFDVNLDLEEEMSIQEVLFEPTSLSDAEKNNTFVYLHVISDDLQLTNENSLPE